MSSAKRLIFVSTFNRSSSSLPEARAVLDRAVAHTLTFVTVAPGCHIRLHRSQHV